VKAIAYGFSTFLADAASLLVYIGGFALIAIGAYLIEPAAGLIVGGAAMVVSVVFYERHSLAPGAEPIERE
jgi:hypothetical protein